MKKYFSNLASHSPTRAYGVILLTGLLFACPAPGGGGGGSAASSDLFSHNSYRFGSSLNAEDALSATATPIGRVLLNESALRTQVASLLVQANGQPLSSEQITRIGDTDYSLSYRIIPENVNPGEIDPANYFFSVANLPDPNNPNIVPGVITIVNPDAAVRTWTLEEVQALLSGGGLRIEVSVAVATTDTDEGLVVLTSNPNLLLRNSDRSETSSQVFVAISTAPSRDLADALEYNPAAITEVVNASLTSYNFLINASVDENNALDQALRFPALNGRGMTSNFLSVYGLSIDGGQDTLFYRLSNQDDIDEECGASADDEPGVIYVDNRDFQIRARPSLNHENSAQNQFSCRLSLSTDGINYRWLAFILPEPDLADRETTGEQLDPTNVSNANLALNDANAMHYVVSDRTNSTATMCADGVGAYSPRCFYADVDLMVDDVPESPTLDFNGLEAGTVAWTSEGIGPIPFYDRANIERFPASDEQFLLNFNRTDEDAGQALDASSVNIEIVSVSPNDALPAHHPLFSARNRTLNNIRDRLVSFTLDTTFGDTGIVSIMISPDRSMFDYESASVFNENGNAEYILTLRSEDLEEDDSLRQPPAEFTVRLQILDVRYEPVFVDASNLDVTQAGLGRRLPLPLADNEAFIVEDSNPRTSINTTATDDGPAISLLPDFRAFLQNRIGILSAINPETGASYEGVEYQILPATGNTGSNIVTEAATPSAEQTMLLDNIAFIDDTSVNNIASGRLIVSAPGLSASNQDTPIRMFMRASIPQGDPDNPNAVFEINAPASFVISEDAADANEQLSMLVEGLASGVNASMATSIRAAGVVTETLPGSRTGSNVNVTLFDTSASGTNMLFASSDDVNNNLKHVLGIAEDVQVNFGLLSGNFVQQLGGGFPSTLVRDLQSLDENVGTSFDSSIFEIRPENAATGVISVRAGREVSFLRPYTIAVVINDASADPDSPNQGFQRGVSNIALVQIYPQDMAQAPSAIPARLSRSLQENQDIRNLAVSLTDDVLGYAANSEFSIFSDTQALSLAGTPFSIGTGGGNADAIALLEEHLSLEIDANNRLSITNSQRLDFETAGLAAALSGFNITITDTGSYTWLRSEATNDASIAFSDIFLSSPQATLADDNNTLTIEVAIELQDVANEPIVFEINTTNPGSADFATQYSIEENATQDSMLGMLNGQSTGIATLFLRGNISPPINDLEVLASNISLELANDPVSRRFRDVFIPEFVDNSFTLPTDADSNSRFTYAGIDLRLIDSEALGELGDSVNFEGVRIIATTTDNRRPRQTDDHSIDIMIDDVPAALSSQDDIQTAIRAAISGEGAASAVIRESDSLALRSLIPTSSSNNIQFAQIPLSALSTETDEFYRFPGGINVRRAVPELSLLSVALSGSTAELDNETIISIQAPSERELNNPNLDPVYRLFLANRGYVESSLFEGLSLSFAASLGSSTPASPTLAIDFEEPTADQGGKNLEFADGDGDRNSAASPSRNDVYSLTYTQTALAEPLATGMAALDDPQFLQATNISDDDGMDRTSETLDLPSNPSNFVRLVAEEEVYNTVLLEGRRYIARDRTAREDNRASGGGLAATSGIVPQGDSRAYVAAINLDIDVPDFNPDNARFEILAQRPDDPATAANENDGSLVRADGNRLDGDPAMNFRAYWEQPLVWNRGTEEDPVYQLNITQRVYNARNATNAPNNMESYNALDTLQLYRNTMQDELSLSYLIRVSADSSYTNASNYAMAQFNVNVRPAGMGQGTQVLAVALVPDDRTIDLSTFEDEDLAEDEIADTIDDIASDLNSITNAIVFTRTDSGDFTSPDIMKNANGIAELDPNDFDDYDLLLVLGNRDGEAAGEGPSTINIEGLDSTRVQGTSTEANDGDLIALRPAGATEPATPAAGAAVAEQMSPDFATMTGDQSVYSISYDFALAQNYDGTARFNIVVQEADVGDEAGASSDTSITINVMPVEPEPDTLGVTLVATDQSGVTTDFAEIASNASGPSDTTNAQPLSFSEIAVQAEASFTYTGLPTGADTDPGGLDRQVMLDDIVVSFEANGDPSRENPGGTASRPTEIFVFETDSTDNLLMYKNNAWGSDRLIHRVTYMEPRGFALTPVSYMRDFVHYVNVENVNDPVSLVASNFTEAPLRAMDLLTESGTRSEVRSGRTLSFMDADLAYDNNIARVLTGTGDDPTMLSIDADLSSTPADLITDLPLMLTADPTSGVITGEQVQFTFGYTQSVMDSQQQTVQQQTVRRADPGRYDVENFRFTAGGGTPVTASGTGTIDFMDVNNNPMVSAAAVAQVPQDRTDGFAVVTLTVTDNDIAKAIGNRGSFNFTIVGTQPAMDSTATLSLPIEFRSATNTSIDANAGTLQNIIQLNNTLSGAHLGFHDIVWRVTDTKGLTTREVTRSDTIQVRVTGIPEPASIMADSIVITPTGTAVSDGSNDDIDIDLLAPQNTMFQMSLTYTDEDFSDSDDIPSHSHLEFDTIEFTIDALTGTDYTCRLGAGRINGGTLDRFAETLTITNQMILLGSGESPSALTLANIINNHDFDSTDDTATPGRCAQLEVGSSISAVSFTNLQIFQTIDGGDPAAAFINDLDTTSVSPAADDVAGNVFTGYRTIAPSVSAEDIDGLLARTRTTQRIEITLTDNDPDDGTPQFPMAQRAQDGSATNMDLIDRTGAPSSIGAWDGGSIEVSSAGCPLPGFSIPSERNQMLDGIAGTNTGTLSFEISYEISNRDVLIADPRAIVNWVCNFILTGLEDTADSIMVGIGFSTDAEPLADFSVDRQPTDDHPGIEGISRNGPSGTGGFPPLVESTIPVDDRFIANFTISDDDLAAGNRDLYGTHTFELLGDSSGLLRFRDPDLSTEPLTAPADVSDDGNTLFNGTLVRGNRISNPVTPGEREGLINLNRQLQPEDIGRHTINWRITDTRSLPPDQVETGSFNVSIGRVDDKPTLTSTSVSANSIQVENFNAFDYNNPGLAVMMAGFSYDDPDFAESFNFPGITRIDRSIDHSNVTFDSITLTSSSAPLSCTLTNNDNIWIADNTPTYTDNETSISGSLMIGTQPLSIASFIDDPNCDTEDLRIGDSFTALSLGGMSITQGYSDEIFSRARAVNLASQVREMLSSPLDFPEVAPFSLPSVNTDFDSINVSGYRTLDISANVDRGADTHEDIQAGSSVLGTIANNIAYRITNVNTPINVIVALTDNDPDDGTPAVPTPNALVVRTDSTARAWPNPGLEGIALTLNPRGSSSCALYSGPQPTLTQIIRADDGIDLSLSVDVSTLSENDSGACWINITGLEDNQAHGAISFSYEVPALPRSSLTLMEDPDRDNVTNALDRDDDGDGLIEINNLTDLEAVRNDLDGDGRDDTTGTRLTPMDGCQVPADLSGSSQTPCNGYELMADIDLTDMAGGWTPIGTNSEDGRFTAIFEGNGYRINDMRIIIDANLDDGNPDSDPATRSGIGFFGAIEDATIRNVHLINASILFPGFGRGAISSAVSVGGLVGIAQGSSSIIASTVVANTTQGTDNVGTLIGFVNGSAQVTGNAALALEVGVVDDSPMGLATTRVGGLVGRSVGTSELSASYTNNYAVVRNARGAFAAGLAGLAEHSDFDNGWAIVAYVNNSTDDNSGNAQSIEVGALFGELGEDIEILGGSTRTSLLWSNQVFHSRSGSGALLESEFVVEVPIGVPTPQIASDGTRPGITGLTNAEFIDGTPRFSMFTSCPADSRAGSAIESWNYGSLPTNPAYPTIACYASAAAGGAGLSTSQQQVAIPQIINIGNLDPDRSVPFLLISDDFVDFATIIAGLRQ